VARTPRVSQEQPEEPPEVGVRQGAPVPVSPLRLPGQAEDAHCPSHGAHAQGEDIQARARLGGFALVYHGRLGDFNARPAGDPVLAYILDSNARRHFIPRASLLLSPERAISKGRFS
jgi:hypothetical protein